MTAKFYKLSLENIDELSQPRERLYKTLFYLVVLTFALHIGVSTMVRESNLLLTIMLGVIYGFMSFIFYRSWKNTRLIWSSYELVIDDEKIVCKQLSGPGIEIHKDEIIKLQEIVPEGSLLVQTDEQKRCFGVPRLHDDYEEIREQLKKWKEVETVSQFKMQIQATIVIFLVSVAIGILTVLELVYIQLILPLGFFIPTVALIMFVTTLRGSQVDRHLKLVCVVGVIMMALILIAVIIKMIATFFA